MVGGLPGYLGIRAGRLRARQGSRSAIVTEEYSPRSATPTAGCLAAIVDHITGVVVYPLIKPGQWAATTEVKLNYIAPVQTGALEAESTVLAMTNRRAAYGGDLLPTSAR